MSDEIEILTKNLHEEQKKGNKSEEIKILVKLAQFHYKENNFEKSKLLFNQVLEKNKDIEGINYYLALIEIQFENYNKAKFFLKKELELNKNNDQAKILISKLEIESNFPIITLSLILLNSLVFFFTYPQIGLIELIRFSVSSDNFNFFTSLSSIFFHINLIHFSINMVFLLMFGLIIEKIIGSSKFLLIYLVSGVIGNFLEAFLGVGNFVIGSSSAIFGIVGATLLREPLLNMRIFGIIKVPIIIVFGGFFAISSLILSFMNSIEFMSGDIAHLTGFLIGILITGILYRQIIFVFYNWLFIGAGFWLISISIQNLINQNFNYIFFLIQFFLIIIGLFLIIYSYFKLKLEILGGGNKNEN